AELMDRAGQFDRAAADIDTAIRLRAESTVIVQAADRAAARANQPSDWTRVGSLLATAAKDPRLPIEARYHLAIASLKPGERAGYKGGCGGIAGRMPPPGTMPEFVDAITAAHAFRVGSDATDDWAVSLSWTERVLARMAAREAADPSVKEAMKPLKHLFL